MHKFIFVIAAAFFLNLFAIEHAWTDAPASIDVSQQLLPGAKKLGSGRLKFLGWSIYDATLYSHGRQFSFNKPFMLTLKYHLAAEGEEIARRSIESMRGLGFKNEVRLATWYRQMQKIFPNVQKGVQLTGVYIPRKGTRFYLGRRLLGGIHDPQFGIWFFKIWLSEKSSQPGLRRKLLGMQ